MSSEEQGNSPTGANGAGNGGESPSPRRAYPSWVETLREEAVRKSEELDEVRRGFARLRDEQRSRMQRMERDLEQRIRVSTGDAVESLLEVVDNLELAIQAGEQSEDVRSIVEGVSMVRDLFLNSLGRLGLEKIEAVGHPFDPEVAEAVGTEEVEERDRHGIVIAEHRSGYRYQGVLLRPANVVVGKHPDAAEEEVAREETAVEPVPQSAQEPEAGSADAEPAPESPPAVEEPTGGVDSTLDTGEIPPPAGTPERVEGDETPEERGDGAADDEDDEIVGGSGVSPAEIDFEDDEDDDPGSSELDWS